MPNIYIQIVRQILMITFMHTCIDTYIHMYMHTCTYLIFLLEAYIILELDISTIFGFAIFPGFQNLCTLGNTEI